MDLILLHHFLQLLEVLVHSSLDRLSILNLTLRHMGHDLSELHLAKLVKLFRFKHTGFDFSQGLRKDFDLLIYHVSFIDTRGAEELP